MPPERDHGIVVARAFGADVVLACAVEDPSVLDYHYYSSGAVRPRQAALGDVRANLAALVPKRSDSPCDVRSSYVVVRSKTNSSLQFIKNVRIWS